MPKTLIDSGNHNAAVAQALDAEIARLVETVREAADQMSSLEEKVQAAKEQLRVLLMQKGENWSDEDGYARLMADSIRTSYNTRALDELILRDPLRHGWLKDYRKESTVRGGVQVR
jgi:hypothetical protein